MKEVKIVATSDIHGELEFKIPSGDILTISGDICPVNGSHNPTNQMYWLKNHFLPWTDQLIKNNVVKHVVFIAGNHDFVFKKVTTNTTGDFYMSLPDNVHFLNDSGVELEGVKIYGTPWTPTFGNWAFMTCEEALDNIYSKIPEGLDILLSHGPAYGWNDVILKGPYKSYSREDEHIGSKSLRKHILRAKPKHFCYGHIHECSHTPLIIPHINENIERVSETTSNCVSLLNDDYEIEYPTYQFNLVK